MVGATMSSRSTIRSGVQLLAACSVALVLLIGCGGEPSTDALDSAELGNGNEVADDVEQELAAEAEDAIDAIAEADGSDSGSSTTPVFIPDGNPELLSEWAQLSIEGDTLQPSAGVVPYTLRSPLFSDHALKLRTVWFPDGSSRAVYHEEDVFAFPVGTVITKTFYYPVAPGSVDRNHVLEAEPNSDLSTPIDLRTTRLVETRVLAHRESGWVALPYVWDEDQREATLKRSGDLVRLTLISDLGQTDTPFPYVVPNANQCAGCHATNHTTGVIVPIGPKVRHLNTDVDVAGERMPQLGHWVASGLVADHPGLHVEQVAAWDDPGAPIDQRARAYLDINCAHCHNTSGPADTSGLFLEASTDLGPRLGVCKAPVAAGTGTGGRLVGISPGSPDDSIFVFRMTTTDPGAMMPELGRAIIHEDGVDLISAWIESLEGAC